MNYRKRPDPKDRKRIYDFYGGYDEDVIAAHIHDCRRKIDWASLLQRNRGPLDTIGDIVALNTLWDYAEQPNHRYRLRLKYCGKAKTQEEARPDLARIMRALKVIFEDLKVIGPYSESMPYGEYVGDGKLGRLKVCVSSLKYTGFPPTALFTSNAIAHGVRGGLITFPAELRRNPC